MILNTSFFGVGIDESNHGQFPEIFVATFSFDKEDFLDNFPIKKKISKTSPIKKFQKNYNYLIAIENDYERLAPREFMGVLTSSLIYDKREEFPENLIVFIDGYMKNSSKIYTRDLISDFCSFNKNNIFVHSGADFDRTYPIVNYSDAIARHLFRRNCSLKELSKDSERRYFLR